MLPTSSLEAQEFRFQATRSPSESEATNPHIILHGQLDRLEVLLQIYIRQIQLPEILVKLLYYGEAFFVCIFGLCWSITR